MKLRTHVCWPLGFLLLTLGCQPSEQPATRSKSGMDVHRQATQSNALFGSIVSQLENLPESVQLELRPPSIVLDSRNSTDGQDIEAIITRQGGVTEGPHNLLRIPGGNARFKTLEIAPGDTIKYFAIPDRESIERMQEAGEVDIVTKAAINLTVAQVLDNNALLIVGGLSADVLAPAKIEVWRTLDDRMNEISARLGRYAGRRDPPLGWHPTPDESVLKQLTERLNQWLRQTQTSVAKTTNPSLPELVATLPKALLTDKRLAPWIATPGRVFRLDEVRQIQGATWLRDISNRSHGDTTSAVDQATSLFDWTVHNLQLIETTEANPRTLWEVLLYGQASAAQRAWVFVALCRQQNLVATVVEVPSEGGAPYLLVGVLAKKDLMLFDPTLGMPIPGEEASVATLAQLSEQDNLLRALDLEDTPYLLTAQALSQATLKVVAEPLTLTDRAARLSQRLSGVDRLVLTVDADAQAERLHTETGREATLWDFPIKTLRDKLTAGRATRNREVKAFLPFAWRPALWKGRILQFRGRTKGNEATSGPIARETGDFRSAQRLYMSRSVRPKNERLDLRRIGSEVKQQIYFTAKSLGTLWLGQLAYEQGKFKSALHWFENQTLASKWAEAYADGTRYHRARTLEALGEIEQAARLLEADDSPQRHGNQLRAAKLEAMTEDAATDDATTP